jgi:methionyl-tRNA synthetase
MADTDKRFYISTPIYYVNDKPHIGHAYTTLACDFLARFMRMDGYKVHFLTGTDEHGQKVEKSAQKAGQDPQSFTDKVSERFRELADRMHFSNDDFIRTTQKRHKDYVQGIWQRMLDAGHIYLDKYSGWYSVRDECFYQESELVDGKAPTGADVEWVEEPSYFFRLSAFEDKLLELYEKQPEFIMPESRRNEVISFVKSGLQDLSVSRTSFSWGVPVPNDEEHVMYVWLDALFNYVSALEDGKKDFWPCDVHMVGKDILRFHAIYWPAFLMAVDMPLPKKVFAHGWWTNEGQKISKSLGNVIDPLQLIDDFGLDYVRYYLMREIPFGNDGNYSRQGFINRVNAELANNIGNLSQRVLAMIYKNCEHMIPEPKDLQAYDQELLEQAYASLGKMRAHMHNIELNLGLEVVVNLGRMANEYIDRMAPWELRKTDFKRMETVLYILAEVIRVIAILLVPIMPDAAAKMLEQLNISDPSFELATQEHALKPGMGIDKPQGVFPRLDN